MAVRERTLLGFYFSHIQTNKPWCPIHTAGVVEMTRPWRTGRVAIIPWKKYRAFCVGRWTRSIEQDIDEDFEDDRWLAPRWLGKARTKHFEGMNDEGPYSILTFGENDEAT